jgi:hypothetical protein
MHDQRQHDDVQLGAFEMTDRIVTVLSGFGYSDDQIAEGLAYAQQQGAATDNQTFCLAVSRILYTDTQLSDGAMFDGDINEEDDD